MFEKFKGIHKEREIKVREKNNLEVLLDACDSMIKKYVDKITRDFQIDDFDGLYLKIYEQLKEKIPVFSEKDLQSLILAKANNEYADKESEIIGLYTGVLLHLLTERNRAEGRKTRFYINGQGNEFDYLFYFAKEIDTLIVDSFVGDHICASAGSYGGNIDILVINNCQGDYALQNAGSNNGAIKTVMINKCKGAFMASLAGTFEGKIETLALHDVRNKVVLWAKIMRLVLCNNSELSISGAAAQAKQTITGKEAKKEYEKIRKEYNLGEILK